MFFCSPAKIALAIFFLVFPSKSFATFSESEREAIVSARSKKFYNKNSQKREYISFGGSYSTDYNSKDFDVVSRYLYQSSRLINEINFENNNDYRDRGSGENRRYSVKTSELYDATLSSKIRFEENGKNYAVLYHRTLYDEMSPYYYDITNAVGLGRVFLDNKVELDISVGFQDTKNFGNRVNIIPSIRTNFRLSKNLRFSQRGYLFIDRKSMDNGLKSRLIYRLSGKLSFEIWHNFEQRRYEDDNNQVQNLVNRNITVGLIFDLD